MYTCIHLSTTQNIFTIFNCKVDDELERNETDSRYNNINFKKTFLKISCFREVLLVISLSSSWIIEQGLMTLSFTDLLSSCNAPDSLWPALIGWCSPPRSLIGRQLPPWPRRVLSMTETVRPGAGTGGSEDGHQYIMGTGGSEDGHSLPGAAPVTSPSSLVTLASASKRSKSSF